MDIEKPVLFWVRKTKAKQDSVELWGSSFACTPGLGGDARRFNGDVVLISESHRSEVSDSSITRIHVHDQSWHWCLRAPPPVDCPAPPFVVTNYTALRFLRQEEVAFEPSRDWDDLENDSLRTHEFFVCGSDWLGVLRVDKTKSNRRGILMLFSDNPQFTLSPGTPMAFCDDPEDIFATVV